MSPLEQIQQHLRTLRMPTAVEIVGDLLQTATRETWPFENFLAELLEQELEGRSQRRIERLQKSSRLPAGKTMASFNQEHLPLRLIRQLAQLCTGELIVRTENILVFGLPGVGKSHFVAAVGHQLVQAGHSVLFSPTYRLVDELLSTLLQIPGHLPYTFRQHDGGFTLGEDDSLYSPTTTRDFTWVRNLSETR